MALTRADIEFTSHGATLRGWLYPGVGAGPRPGIVMAHGLTAVREMYLDRYAEVFAAAGFTTLAYDHFGFGASDGEPRQWPSPSVQLEGYRDAIAWLAASPGVDADRIGIWGSSFSGGEVIMLAAEDLPIRAAVAQVPGLGVGGPDLPAGALAAVIEALKAGDQDATVPAVCASPDGDGFMCEDGAQEFFLRVSAERAPSWRNEVRVSAFAEPYTPVDALANVRVPLLLVVAPADALTPPGPAIEAAAGVDLVEIVEIPGGHFDVYEAGFDLSSAAELDWFRRHLA